MPTPDHPQSVAVFGLGYVGSVTAACLAQLGHRVLGVDSDGKKVRSIIERRAPFYEPGLPELIERNVDAGRLSATCDAAGALEQAGIALICVGTPSDRNGNMSLDQLHRVFADIARHLEVRTRRLVVALRSTAFPGTTEALAAALPPHAPVSVVCNPEFLREGVAVKDFMEPSLVVVGGDDPAAVRQTADLYVRLGVEPSLVSLRTAEMIKYCCNAFHALKIAFANEIAALADSVDAQAEEAMDVLCRDTRLNISPAYLKPGFAFGGSCLPKDLRALNYRALRLNLDLPLLQSILPSNERHLQRAIHGVLEVPAGRLGIFGLAFKENTDDLRESPVIAAVEHWVGKGREVRIFAPHIQLDRIYGSNRAFVLAALPHIGKLMAESLEELLDWCEVLVVAQKPESEFAARIANCGKPVLNLARAPLAPPKSPSAFPPPKPELKDGRR